MSIFWFCFSSLWSDILQKRIPDCPFYISCMDWANNEQWKYPIIFGEHAHIYLNHKDIFFFKTAFVNFVYKKRFLIKKSDQIYYTNLIYIAWTVLQVECASRNSKPQRKIVPSTANRVTINGLRSGTLFNCSISASTNQGSGPVKSIRVWTKSIGIEYCNDLKESKMDFRLKKVLSLLIKFLYVINRSYSASSSGHSRTIYNHYHCFSTASWRWKYKVRWSSKDIQKDLFSHREEWISTLTIFK